MKVYLISSNTLPLFKIGKSVNPDARLQTLRIGSPTQLSLRAVKHMFNANEAHMEERRIHETLKEYFSHGEWYSPPESKLVDSFGPLMEIQDHSDLRSGKVYEPPTVIKIADGKKLGRPLKSKFVTKDGTFDKAAYQRDYMKRKRMEGN